MGKSSLSVLITGLFAVSALVGGQAIDDSNLGFEGATIAVNLNANSLNSLMREPLVLDSKIAVDDTLPASWVLSSLLRPPCAFTNVMVISNTRHNDNSRFIVFVFNYCFLLFG